MSLRNLMMTLCISGALLSCGLSTETPVATRQARLTPGTLTALEAVGGQKTGIHYSLEGDVLVLTANPFADFARRVEFPSTTGGFTTKVTSYPPDPGTPAVQPLSLSIHPPEPGAPATASLTTYPPDPGKTAGKVACTLAGSGLQAIGETMPPDPSLPQGSFSYTLAAGGNPVAKFLSTPASLSLKLTGDGFTLDAGWVPPPDPKQPWSLTVRAKDTTGKTVFDSALVAMAPCYIKRECLDLRRARLTMCCGTDCTPVGTFDCGNYACSLDQCLTSCTADSDCAYNHVCKDGHCKLRDAYCVDPVVGWSRYVLEVDGSYTNCYPYNCNNGRCLRSCHSAADCAGGLVCDATCKCLPLGASDFEDRCAMY